MAELSLPVEATRSRSGLHAARSIVVVFAGSGARLIEKPEEPGRGTYARGPAGTVRVDASGGVVVHAWLTLNPRRRVKGYFTVYAGGGEVLRAKLSRRKVRLVRGDPGYAWSVEEAVMLLKLSGHVRRYNWGKGSGGR